MVLAGELRTSLARVPDGTSNTLMFGECGGDSYLPNAFFTGAPPTAVMIESTHTVSAMFTWMGCPSQTMVYGLEGPNNFYFGAFSSAHTAVVNFCYADGSVHGLVRANFMAQWRNNRPNAVALTTGGVVDQTWLCLQELAGEHDGQEPQRGLVEP